YGGPQGAIGGGGYGAGGYGAAGGIGGGAAQGARSSMPMPTDAREFQSYINGATNGDGKQDGNVKQNRAMPNTRFGTVGNGDLFKAAVARDYAVQFAAVANGMNGRSAQGLT